MLKISVDSDFYFIHKLDDNENVDIESELKNFTENLKRIEESSIEFKSFSVIFANTEQDNIVKCEECGTYYCDKSRPGLECFVIGSTFEGRNLCIGCLPEDLIEDFDD